MTDPVFPDEECGGEDVMFGRRLPVGIRDFKRMREEGFRYVDKTGAVCRLAHSGGFYFLARPGGFGKSVFVSTLKALFEGRKDIFTGLEIEEADWKWDRHAVFHLDFEGVDMRESDALECFLDMCLCGWEAEYGIVSANRDVYVRFADVIRAGKIATGRKTVILVDGFDLPLVKSFLSREGREHCRGVLSRVFGVVKECESDVRFALVTGCTKLCADSVLSALESVDDISLDGDFDSICGIRESEVLKCYSDEVARLGERYGATEEVMLGILRNFYGGYRFSGVRGESVYNFSGIMSAFRKGRIDDYLSVGSMGGVIAEALRKSSRPVNDMQDWKRSGMELMTLEPHSLDPIAVMYQCGYLTVKGFDPESGLYRLGYPNMAKRRACMDYVVPIYDYGCRDRHEFDIRSFRSDVEEGDVDSFMRRLQSFMGSLPYDHCPKGMSEGRLHDIVFTVGSLMGFEVGTELHTSMGRIDMVVHTSRRIYVFEFKLNHRANDAIRQIERCRYAESFQVSGKEIVCVGVSFSSETRNISEWRVSRYADAG